VALAEQRRIPLVVAHRNRYHPALPVIADRLAAGAFGPMIEVRARGKEDQRGGGQDLCVLGGHLLNVATLFTGAARACSAGILVLGRPATQADARDGDEGVGRIVGDEIHARFETATGVPLFYDSARGAGTTASGFGIQVFCRDALVDLRMDMDPLIHVRQGNPFVPAGASQSWVPFTSAGLGQPEPVADIRGLVLGHRGGIEDLLACVREPLAPLCGAPAARDTIEMIQAVFATVTTGGRVELPLRDRNTNI
jgi:predicted dehydrogenase